MLILNRPPVNTDNNDEHYEKLVPRQMKTEMNYDTFRKYNSIPVWSTVAVQWGWQRTVDTWKNSKQMGT